MIVTLSEEDIERASDVGRLRQSESERKGLKDKHGFSGPGGQGLHIRGACGELAAAKALGIEWQGSVNTFKRGGDVGKFQVRTRSKRWYDLLVRDGDADGDIFILVLGHDHPIYDVVGWIFARDAKKSYWVKGHGGRDPAYFVPQSSLNRFRADLEALKPRPEPEPEPPAEEQMTLF